MRPDGLYRNEKTRSDDYAVQIPSGAPRIRIPLMRCPYFLFMNLKTKHRYLSVLRCLSLTEEIAHIVFGVFGELVIQGFHAHLFGESGSRGEEVGPQS